MSSWPPLVLWASFYLSLYSKMIPIWYDYSSAETIGVVRHAGFPIPWQHTAPGLEIMGSFNLGLFFLNTVVWAVLLVFLLIRVERRLRTGTWERRRPDPVR